MGGTVSAAAINSVTAAESADSTSWDDIGGGPGSAQSIDQPIQGAQNRGRRIDNNVRGMSFDNGSGLDISAGNTHVGWWINVFQPALIGTGGIELILGGGATPTTSPWSGWTYSQTLYPATGGWIRIWLDPTITRDTGTGTLNLASVRQFGAEFDMGDIDGTSDSCHIDRIDYTTTGLLIDGGTGGDPATFTEFVTADFNNSSNRYGVVIEREGIIFCLARLIIADATATVFNDSKRVVVFPQQQFVSSTFMGVTVDLQNASTDVDWNGISLQSVSPPGSGSLVSGDLIVLGTSGAFDVASCVLDKIRIITLTSGCTLSACTITTCGQITMAGASLTSSAISDSVASSAVLWNTASDPATKLDDLTFTRDTSTNAVEDTNHALEYGSNTPATIGLTNPTFNSYHSMADADSPIQFNTETGINGTTEILTTTTVHAYSTGDPIWVNSEGGTETPGITNATRYWVNAQSTTTLSFHTTKADADADTSRVDLTASTAGNGEVWSLHSGYAAIYNNRGGALTINVSGGTIPSVRNGTGASTTIVNSLTLTLTGLIAASEVRIYQAGTTIEEDGIESSGTTFAYTYSNPPGFNVDIKIHKEDYEHLTLYNVVLSTSADASLPVQQRIDRNYSNP